MNPKNIIIIFGSKVLKKGEPSGSLHRRIQGAISFGKKLENVVYLATGAIGDNPPAEAAVISNQLQHFGANPECIIKDENSRDTLESVINCSKILKLQISQDQVYVCSDRYHVLRCSILFKLNGINNKICWIDSGLNANGYLRWTYLWVRDFIALPYDILLLSARLLKTKLF